MASTIMLRCATAICCCRRLLTRPLFCNMEGCCNVKLVTNEKLSNNIRTAQVARIISFYAFVSITTQALMQIVSTAGGVMRSSDVVLTRTSITDRPKAEGSLFPIIIVSTTKTCNQPLFDFLAGTDSRRNAHTRRSNVQTGVKAHTRSCLQQQCHNLTTIGRRC